MPASVQLKTCICQHRRELLEIEAKRQIIGEYREAKKFFDANRAAPAGELHGLYTALKALVSVYDQHPDFQEEWRA